MPVTSLTNQEPNSTNQAEGSSVASDELPNVDDSDEDNAIHSRDKSDMWHEFHNIPWPRDSPCKALISKLLLRATRSINAVEENEVKAVL